MYKVANGVRSSRGRWQQPQKAPEGTAVPGKVREESLLGYGRAPLETHRKCPVTKQAPSACDRRQGGLSPAPAPKQKSQRRVLGSGNARRPRLMAAAPDRPSGGSMASEVAGWLQVWKPLCPEACACDTDALEWPQVRSGLGRRVSTPKR